VSRLEEKIDWMEFFEIKNEKKELTELTKIE